MNMNMQNIINVGLGIMVGFLIWQNDIQQDTIKTLMEYDQIDTDKSFDRIDALEKEVDTLNEQVAILEKDLELYKGIVNKDVLKSINNEQTIAELLKALEDFNETYLKNIDIADKNMKVNEERIIENRKLIRDLLDILRSN